MRNLKLIRESLYIIVIFLPLVGCSINEEKPQIQEGIPNIVLYTAHNIWYENPLNIPSINYKRGAILPVGTKISELEVGKRSFKFQAAGKVFEIYFIPKWHLGQTIENYREKMFRKEKFNYSSAGMTREVFNAVLAGTPIAGMSKKEVIITYGYPPEHRTPNLLSNKWRYWIHRFKTKLICFDQNGLATKNCNTLKDL